MITVLIISIILVLVVLILSVLTISKAYSFKHTIDPTDASPKMMSKQETTEHTK